MDALKEKCVYWNPNCIIATTHEEAVLHTLNEKCIHLEAQLLNGFIAKINKEALLLNFKEKCVQGTLTGQLLDCNSS